MATHDGDNRNHPDKEQFMKGILKRNWEAFSGKYQKELKELLGLSELEILTVTGTPVDRDILEALIAAVMVASRQEVSAEELVSRIRSLGQIAVSIAKMLPSLAERLV